MDLVLKMPPLPDGRVPRWVDTSWMIEGTAAPFLPYTRNFDGWSDDLTNMHERESGADHPIDVASRARAIAALRRFGFPANGTLLEIGSASGYLLEVLRETYPKATTIGSDVIPDALYRLNSKLPGVPLLQIDITDCPLPSASFDAIIALNVLEHIKNDGRAVREMARLLKPGGILLLEVPAGPALFDGYDAFLQHFRRYTAANFRALMCSARLEIVCQDGLGFLVYPAFWLSKKLNRIRYGQTPKADLVAQAIRGTKENAILKIAFTC